MRGSMTTARAIAVRCFWPPDSVMPRSPDHRVVALREVGDVLVEPRDRRRLLDAPPTLRVLPLLPPCPSCPSRPPSRRIASSPNAMLSASVSEKRNGSCGTKPIAPRSTASGIVADVDAVDEHRAGRRIVQPRQQADQRRLPRAGDADERHGLPGLDAGRDVVEDRRAVVANARSRNSISPRMPVRLSRTLVRSSVSVRCSSRPWRSSSAMAGTASSTSSIRFQLRHAALEHVRDPAEGDHRPASIVR